MNKHGWFDMVPNLFSRLEYVLHHLSARNDEFGGLVVLSRLGPGSNSCCFKRSVSNSMAE